MLVDKLTEYLKGPVEDMGYIFWGIETDQGQKGRGPVLRIYIDHEEGISLDDCQAVSNELTAIMDVEDLISTQYVLEVSSPGVDRRVFSLPQAESLVDFDFKVNLYTLIESNEFKGKKFKGTLTEVNEEILTFIVDGQSLKIDFSNIDKMRVIPKW